MSAQPDDTYIGVRLGSRYELSELLAQGSLCAVYRAHDASLQRPIAVKVAPPEVHEAYLSALHTTASLSHPGVISTYDAYVRQSHLFLIQEYVAAHPLGLYLREGAPVKRAVDLIGQIARTLAYAHGRGILHGDLTPTSVLVDRHATVRLNNFGLPADEAYFTAMERAIVSARSDDPTEDALDFGSISKAPSVFPAGASVERDVWAVGLLLWQLLASPVELGVTQSSSSVMRREFRDDVPLSLRDLTRRCILHAHPDRIYDAETLALGLEDEAQRLAQDHPRMSSLTPPALRVAREAVHRESVWSVGETIASRRQWVADAPTASATLVAPTDPMPLDVGATRPTSERPSKDVAFAPRLRLPSRPMYDAHPAAPNPGSGAAPWSTSSPDTYVQDMGETSGVRARPGLSTAMWFLICVLLFALCFVVGYMSPPLTALFK